MNRKEVKEMAKAQEMLYAVVGAGEFAIEKAKDARSLTDPKSTQKLYKDFVKRGRSLSTRIKNSGPTKQAIAQTKTARSRIRGAATSVTKAAQATAKGTRTAPAQTKIAQRQVKAAATSVKKAAKASGKATKSAAQKATQAS
jgi:hypothetical protein